VNPFLAARAAIDQLLADPAALANIERAGGLFAERLRAGRTILCIGNGGSMCDAAHFAEELSGRFRADRPPLAAIACTDAGHLTCTANDYGFEQVFSRWVSALGKPGDVLVAFTTSGQSPNILRALEAAKARGLTTVGLLGKGGGAARALCDVPIIVPGQTSDRVQELHKIILHAWCESLESVRVDRA
jgi:D-sedoheptulose 7-phosphate isomerase